MTVLQWIPIYIVTAIIAFTFGRKYQPIHRVKRWFKVRREIRRAMRNYEEYKNQYGGTDPYHNKDVERLRGEKWYE